MQLRVPEVAPPEQPGNCAPLRMAPLADEPPYAPRVRFPSQHLLPTDRPTRRPLHEVAGSDLSDTLAVPVFRSKRLALIGGMPTTERYPARWIPGFYEENHAMTLP